MNNKIIIKTIASLEMLIGLVTLSGISIYALFAISKKPINVFLFVLISSLLSTTIGLGLLNYKNWARTLIIFFSGYVLITKILILTGLMRFNGEILTAIPSDLKSMVSIFYHTFIMFFFNRQAVKGIFAKK